MLALLCALVNIVTTKEQLNEAVTHSEPSFKALATQTRQTDQDAKYFLEVVKGNMYDIQQWKWLCESYLKYMGGDRWESAFNNSDWFADQACNEGTSSACEHGELRYPKYCGPKVKP